MSKEEAYNAILRSLRKNKLNWVAAEIEQAVQESVELEEGTPSEDMADLKFVTALRSIRTYVAGPPLAWAGAVSRLRSSAGDSQLRLGFAEAGNDEGIDVSPSVLSAPKNCMT